MNNDIKRAEYLGRLIGATRWCDEDIELCDKNMLVDRLKRISALSDEIFMELMDLTRQIVQMPALGIAHTCVGIAMSHSKHNLGVIYFDCNAQQE